MRKNKGRFDNRPVSSVRPLANKTFLRGEKIEKAYRILKLSKHFLTQNENTSKNHWTPPRLDMPTDFLSGDHVLLKFSRIVYSYLHYVYII